VFTAQYTLSPYIKLTLFMFKGIMVLKYKEKNLYFEEMDSYTVPSLFKSKIKT
jgi:hypothetical protein